MSDYKWYKHRGYRYCATHNFIEANVNRLGIVRKEMRPVYHIEGLKDAGTRPFLTSLQQCKDFIDLAIWKAKHDTANTNNTDTKESERRDNA